MEVEVISERDNPFLDRREYRLGFRHGGEATPSRETVVRHVVERMGLERDKVFVASLETYTGMGYTVATIYYYPNGIDWSTIEPSKRWKVKAGGEEESKA